MKSDKLGHIYWKSFFLMFAISFGLFTAKLIIEGIKTGHWKTILLIIALLLLLFFLVLILFVANNFKIVEFTEGRIIIKDKKKPIEVLWNEVESFQLLSLTNPPIYILKLKDIKGYILFVAPFTFFGHYIDNSELGVFIDKMRLMHDF